MPKTADQYRRMVMRFAAFWRAHPGPLDEQLAAFFASLTPAMRHQARLGLRDVYPEAIAWETLRCPQPKRNEAILLGTLFTPEETAKIRALATPRERAMLELLWTLRRVEAARAHWGDLNRADGTLVVVRKGGRTKTALLTASAQRALADWFVASGHPPDTAAIFPGRNFGRASNRPSGPTALHYETVSQIIRRLLKRAGVYRHWRGAHAWRRTFATVYMKENPQDISGLAKLLGHECLSTTYLYNWLQPADLRPRLDRVVL